jgi:ComF family protein
VRDALNALGYWLLPGACASCWEPIAGPEEDFLCPGCRMALEVVAWPACACSQAPAAPGTKLQCSLCKPLPASFCSARAAFPYGGVVGQMIRNLKYRRGEHLADPLARLVIARLGPWIDGLRERGHVDLLMPAPIHSWRRFKRGFNQAEALAAGLARLTGLPVEAHGVQRIANPRAQARRHGHDARLAAMVGAFAVLDPARVQGRGVLLVDDVMTTGATMSRCAEALMAGGAREVHLLAVAIAGAFPREPAPEAMRRPQCPR